MHAHLLLDTLVVTAVTEASEIVSGSGPLPNLLSKSSVSKMAGSSENNNRVIVIITFILH